MNTEFRPVMNDTKWRELIVGMRKLQERGLIVHHHAKDVTGPWPSPRGWDGEWFYHLVPWSTLEWVDIRCEEREGPPYKSNVRLSAEEVASVHSEICTWLKGHGIPFSIEEGVLRVWGYTRPGRQPEWCP